MTDSRLTRLGAEVLAINDEPASRLARLGAEILAIPEGIAAARLTRIGVEVLALPVGQAQSRATRLGVEVLALELELPDPPTNLVVTQVSFSQLDLDWDDNSDNETGYRVERSLNGSTGWVTVAGALAADSESFSDTSLDCETEYFYRVIAFNDDGDSAASNVDSATTADCPLPVAPSNLVATAAGPTQIDLTWDDNSNDENGFKVDRSLDGVGGWANVSGSLALGTETYSDTTVVCETEYFYRVIAFSGEGDSTPSNVDSAVSGDCPSFGNRIGNTGAVRKPPR